MKRNTARWCCMSVLKVSTSRIQATRSNDPYKPSLTMITHDANAEEQGDDVVIVLCCINTLIIIGGCCSNSVVCLTKLLVCAVLSHKMTFFL